MGKGAGNVRKRQIVRRKCESTDGLLRALFTFHSFHYPRSLDTATPVAVYCYACSI